MISQTQPCARYENQSLKITRSAERLVPGSILMVRADGNAYIVAFSQDDVDTLRAQGYVMVEMKDTHENA